MAYLILGLLMIRSLTIYEIKNTLEKKISPFYAASFGSIQSAVKKLLASQYIDFTEKVENGRNKKVFFVTPEGQKAFLAWMKEEIQVNKFNNDALVKIFFFGFLPKADRIRVLSNYIERLKREAEAMSAFQGTAGGADVPEKQKEIYTYQMATLDYGIRGTAFEIQWYEELLKKMELEEI